MNQFISIFLVIILFIISVLVYIFYHKRSFYPYNVCSDYNIDMNTEPILIQLKDNHLILPKNYDNTFTVIMKVKVTSTLLGNFFSPHTVINNTTFKQYYEKGTNGIRYINLSNTINDESIVKFKNHYCRISNQTVEIYTYKNEEIKNEKILIISPHPDDAELSAYGLYSENSSNVLIVTITAGENGVNLYNIYPSEDSKKNELKGKIRTWNSLTVPMLGGLKSNQVLNLGYFDYTLKTMHDNPNSLISSSTIDNVSTSIFREQNYKNTIISNNLNNNWNGFLDDIQSVIEYQQPTIIITPHPQIDGHVDHKYATIALMEVIRKIDYRKGSIFFYTNHFPDAHYFPYGFSKSILSLPPIFNNPICFQKLFSFYLDEHKQNEKILAMDAMNDLRINHDYLSGQILTYNGLKKIKQKMFDIEKDYFNKFVRSNEFFYAISTEMLFDEEVYKLLLQSQND